MEGYLNAKTIQKYKDKSISDLKKIATRHFNEFIRERDKDKGCVSCGARVVEAGHFYSGGHYPPLKFNENNVHGQCKRCNGFLSGNLNEYRKRITQRITEDELKELDFISEDYQRNGYKWDRFYLIEIIEKYKWKQ